MQKVRVQEPLDVRPVIAAISGRDLETREPVVTEAERLRIDVEAQRETIAVLETRLRQKEQRAKRAVETAPKDAAKKRTDRDFRFGIEALQDRVVELHQVINDLRKEVGQYHAWMASSAEWNEMVYRLLGDALAEKDRLQKERDDDRAASLEIGHA